MFEQLLSHSETVRLNIAKLIDESLAHYHARINHASIAQPTAEVSDFDIRDYV